MSQSQSQSQSAAQQAIGDVAPKLADLTDDVLFGDVWERPGLLETHPGETVACPPGEEHWHGATPEQFMEHLALWEGDGSDTPETTWLEPVTDEQYRAARSNTR